MTHSVSHVVLVFCPCHYLAFGQVVTGASTPLAMLARGVFFLLPAGDGLFPSCYSSNIVLGWAFIFRQLRDLGFVS